MSPDEQRGARRRSARRCALGGAPCRFAPESAPTTESAPKSENRSNILKLLQLREPLQQGTPLQDRETAPTSGKRSNIRKPLQHPEAVRTSRSRSNIGSAAKGAARRKNTVRTTLHTRKCSAPSALRPPGHSVVHGFACEAYSFAMAPITPGHRSTATEANFRTSGD